MPPVVVFKSECHTLKLIINKSPIYLKQLGFTNFNLQQSQKKRVGNNKESVLHFLFNTVMALFKTQLHKSINFKDF